MNGIRRQSIRLTETIAFVNKSDLHSNVWRWGPNVSRGPTTAAWLAAGAEVLQIQSGREACVASASNQHLEGWRRGVAARGRVMKNGSHASCGYGDPLSSGGEDGRMFMASGNESERGGYPAGQVGGARRGGDSWAWER